MRAAMIVLGLVATIGSTVVVAAPCAGFSDVDDADPFCINVTWMKNRGVTLGCAVGLYCPGGAVSRLAMAAFLNRMANLITAPIWVDANGKSVGPVASQNGFAYWRTPHGPARLTFAFDGSANGAHWNRDNDFDPYYTTGDCTGQAYVRTFDLTQYPIRFYWRGTQYRAMRVQRPATPAILPGVVYVNQVANVTAWQGGQLANSCVPLQVGIATLFVPGTDVMDVTNEFVPPFRLE